MSGFIMIPRHEIEYELFHEPRVLSRWEAWIDLVRRANWKDGRMRIGREIIPVPRGSFVTSIMELSRAWKWHRRTVDRFLAHLECGQSVVLTMTRSCALVVIVNYEKYQGDFDLRAHEGTIPCPHPVQSVRTIEEKKKLRTRKEPSSKDEGSTRFARSAREGAQPFGEYVMLKPDEHAKLCAEHGPACVEAELRRYDGWIAQSPTGKSQKPHTLPTANNYRGAINWIERAREKGEGFFAPKNGNQRNGITPPRNESIAERNQRFFRERDSR